MANAHKVKFISFGDIIREDIIQPGNITSFAERIRIITEPKIKRAEQLGTLNSNELAYLKHTLQSELSDLEDVTKTSSLQPILAITDIHPKNFLVDDNGKPSGYFDLEYCQSAPPALDFYFLRWFLLNYFEGISDQAEEALLERYTANGGTYDSKNPTNKKLEYLLSINRLMQAVNEYHGLFDELRKGWSGQFKQILFNSMDEGEINYPKITSVFRSWTKQPLYAT